MVYRPFCVRAATQPPSSQPCGLPGPTHLPCRFRQSPTCGSGPWHHALQSCGSQYPNSTTGRARARTFQHSWCCNAQSSIQQHPCRRCHQVAHEARAYEKSCPPVLCAVRVFEDAPRSSARSPLTWDRCSATSTVAMANKPGPGSRRVRKPSLTWPVDQYWESGRQCFHKPPRHWPSGHLT